MRLLFFGELYPDVVHGVSIANRLNLDMLGSMGVIDIDKIQEKTQVLSIGKSSFSKIKTLFSSIIKIWQHSRKNSYQTFYLVISLSLLGLLKTLFAVYAFSLRGQGEVVLHLHRGDFVPFYHRHWWHRLLIKLCFHRVSRLIVLSEGQKTEMSTYFPSDFIYVVENTVLEEKQLPSFEVKDSFNNRFLYISNYIKEKGVFDLLDAFEMIDDVELHCYGAFTGNEAVLRDRENAVIRIHSSIGGVEKFNTIHSADALILPSWNEGQPTIILEAMLVGTPILTTNVGLVGELLGEDYPFYFSPQNPADLSACVKRFIAYEDKAALSCQLQQRYFQFFSHTNHQNKLFKAFGLNAI